MEVAEEYGYIKSNLETVREKAEKAATRAGVPVPKLLAVTKSATDLEVLALLAAGQKAIGENRTALFNSRLDLAEKNGFSVEAHLIGSLQSNKVKTVADRVTMIHSADSVSLLREIEKQAAKNDRKIPVLIEINSGREPAKGGVMPEDAAALHEFALSLPHIAVAGLMTMAPNCENPDDYHRYFSETRRLFERLRDEYGFAGDPVLSMGMSQSYEIAIEEGATLVRVGRSLFQK